MPGQQPAHVQEGGNHEEVDSGAMERAAGGSDPQPLRKKRSGPAPRLLGVMATTPPSAPATRPAMHHGHSPGSRRPIPTFVEHQLLISIGQVPNEHHQGINREEKRARRRLCINFAPRHPHSSADAVTE